MLLSSLYLTTCMHVQVYKVVISIISSTVDGSEFKEHTLVVQ